MWRTAITGIRLGLRVLQVLHAWPRDEKCHADIADHVEWLPECPCRNTTHTSGG